jgi:hypothetical protein
MHSQKRCYACQRLASTVEHVPPKCFFPEALRTNLITVPSCARHNNDNSKDVEYVRNLLVFTTELGPESKAVFSRAIRSMEHRPALWSTMFPDIQKIQFQGRETAAFSIDLVRLKRVMAAIVQALHFRDFAIKWRRWRIFSPTLHSIGTLSGRTDEWESLRTQLATARYKYLPTGQQDVFAYGRIQMRPSGHLYQLVFYNAVIVNAWPLRRTG